MYPPWPNKMFQWPDQPVPWHIPGAAWQEYRCILSSSQTFARWNEFVLFIQCFGSVFIWYGYGYILGWIPIRIHLGFWWPKIWKNLQQKICFVDQYFNLPNPRPSERTSKLQNKPSALEREHPALFPDPKHSLLLSLNFITILHTSLLFTVVYSVFFCCLCLFRGQVITV